MGKAARVEITHTAGPPARTAAAKAAQQAAAKSRRTRGEKLLVMLSTYEYKDPRSMNHVSTR